MKIYRCCSCAEATLAPPAICSKCMHDEFELGYGSTQGVLISFTTIRRAPAGINLTSPYHVCVVEMTDGLRVTGVLEFGDSEPELGQSVYELRQDGMQIHFSSSPNH